MSTLTTPSQLASTSLRRLVKAHPLASFFALAFGLTWLLYLIPNALAAQGRLPFEFPFFVGIFGSYGPTWAALIVTGLTTGKAGVRHLLSRLLIWRVGLRWWLVTLLTHPVLFLLGFGLYALTGGTLPSLPQPSLDLALQVLLYLVVLGLINGEEIGWRGFALPHLQARHSALTTSLALTGVAFLFHLPLFWTPGAPQAAIGMPGFLVISFATSILIGWIYNNTRGSLLLAYLFHAAQNTWTQILPVGTDGPLLWFPLGMMALAAIVIVMLFGPARLSRQPASAMPTLTDAV